MKHLVKFFMMCSVIVFFQTSLCYATVLGQAVGVPAQYNGGAKEATLNAEVRNISGDNISNVTFNGIDLPNFGIDNPWVLADQYLKIDYNCNYPSWGIRIITDNKTEYPTMVGTPLDSDLDGMWGTADDKLTYGGLVNTLKLDNPSCRALLGWQIYKDKITNPLTPHDSDFGDSSIDTDDWNSNWAYVVDKSNSDYSNEIITEYFVDPVDDTLKAKYNYNISVFGSGSLRYLSWHPYDDASRLADLSVIVYLSARFCSNDYSVFPAGESFILPHGNYNAKIYIELAFE